MGENHLSSIPTTGLHTHDVKQLIAILDRLAAGGFSAWQMLPLCIPDGHGSPYSSCSTFSLNPYFIDLEALAEEGLLTKEELAAARQRTPYSMEWERLRKERLPLLRKAAMRAANDPVRRNAVEALPAGDIYVRENCRYLALREAYPALTAAQLSSIDGRFSSSQLIFRFSESSKRASPNILRFEFFASVTPSV